jgi:adenylate cyclase
MSDTPNGELDPLGGGEPIPLSRTPLTVGRRESCDIVLQFPNISGMHCELNFRDGYWSIRDLNSANGIKVNGSRVPQRALRPGDEVAIGKMKFSIRYTPSAAAQKNLEEILSEQDDVFGTSLLEKAGLQKAKPGDRTVSSRRISIEDELDD